MLLVEDLLLLLTDDDTGKLTKPGAEVDVALGGALLVELALRARVGVAGPDERVRRGRLVLEDPVPTGDVLLDEALRIVGEREGKRPQDVVPRLGPGSARPCAPGPRTRRARERSSRSSSRWTRCTRPWTRARWG